MWHYQDHDQKSAVPLDMGQPVPALNPGAHLLQTRSQTNSTRHRTTSRTGRYIQVMIIVETAVLRTFYKMEYVIIQTNHFIQGCVEHPSPPPHATDHPTPHDLQGSVSKAVWSFSENSPNLRLRSSLISPTHFLHLFIFSNLFRTSTYLCPGWVFNWRGGHLFETC